MAAWTVSTLNDTVTQELERLPASMRAKFIKIGELIEKFGPQKVGMPHTRSLGDKFWEIRASGKEGISRGIYVAVKDRQVIVLRVFVKKDAKDSAKRNWYCQEKSQGGWTDMTKISTLHKKWSKEPAYKAAYDGLQAEFRLAEQLIEARINSGLSQEELAQKMGTSQSTIARLESGSSMPSMRTLSKFAKATNCEMQIQFKQLPKSARSKAAA